MTEIDLFSLDRYLFLDPAGKKRAGQNLKKVRANQAIVGVAADHLGRIFVFYAWRGRIKTHELIERVLSLSAQYKPRQFGIEANAMQELFAESVHYVAKLKRQHVPIVPVYQPTKVDKDFRIRTTLQPLIGNGRLIIPAHFHELRTEIASFPTGMLKDLIDALASAVAMVPQRTTRSQRDGEREQLREYLGTRNIAPWNIERAIEDIVGT